MASAVILLGGNEGDSVAILKLALAQIKIHCGRLVKVSNFYQSPAWGFEAIQAFVNQAVLINTDLNPQDLLTQLLDIEQGLGRVRTPTQAAVYSSRTIDLDILLYHNLVIDTSVLQVPHPRLVERRFALMPLQELLPEWIHPINGLTATQLLAQCTDESVVNILG